MEAARGQHGIALSVLSAAIGACLGIGLLLVLSRAGDRLAAEISPTGDASLDGFLQGVGLWPLMWVQAAIAPVFVIAGALIGLQICERLRPRRQLEGWTCPYDPSGRGRDRRFGPGRTLGPCPTRSWPADTARRPSTMSWASRPSRRR